ncbi:MAG: helix-turn-helix domain-containing protein [Gemmatimonadaceae bacterium]|nr:helix-turn-helix domain-containing protein [Gemmatimonadaceae bacterium]
MDNVPGDQSFGARLRQRREERHIRLIAIADQTKIKLSLLQALERDDVSHWPSGIFRRAYVRTYAQFIGLDPDVVVREFLEALPTPGTSSWRPPPPRLRPRRRRQQRMRRHPCGFAPLSTRRLDHSTSCVDRVRLKIRRPPALHRASWYCLTLSSPTLHSQRRLQSRSTTRTTRPVLRLMRHRRQTARPWVAKRLTSSAPKK